MKKLILLFLLIPSLCFGDMNTYIAGIPAGDLTTKFQEVWTPKSPGDVYDVEPSSSACESGYAWLANETDQYLLKENLGPGGTSDALVFTQAGASSVQCRNTDTTTIASTSSAKVTFYFKATSLPEAASFSFGTQHTNADIISITVIENDPGGVTQIDVRGPTGTVIANNISVNVWYYIVCDNFDWTGENFDVEVFKESDDTSQGTKINIGFKNTGALMNRIKFLGINGTGSGGSFSIGEVKIEE